MIRINLLEVRPRSAERFGAILGAGRSSTFISRREGILGVVFLALTAVILAVLAMRFGPGGGEPTEVAAASEPAPELETVVPETPPEPAPEPQPLLEEPPAVIEPAPPEPAERAPERRRPAQGSLADAPSERALSGIRATPLSGQVDVFLELPGVGEVQSFRLENPPRLVFDIPGATLTAPDRQRNQRLASPLVERLRIAQFRLEPPVVRLVLELGRAPAEAEVSTSAAGVSVRVTAP